MKITVQHLHSSFNRSYELKSPGATFGRSPENQIVLPDPSVSISLFQAAIKVKKTGEIEIRNLAATPILIGNHSIRVGQSLNLQETSQFTCGNFKFQLEGLSAPETPTAEPEVPAGEQHSVRAPTVMPMPGTQQALIQCLSEHSASPPQSDLALNPEHTEAPLHLLTTKETTPKSNVEAVKPTEKLKPQESPSVFDDLFSGNGVVPIGVEPNYQEVHPFEMASATVRNTEDPLAEITAIELDEALSKDPLERLSRDGIEHQQRDIFYDNRPSTLLHDEQDKPQNNSLNDLDKILRDLESYAKS